ncbi:hypothetical protein EsDP_00002840 [Epichloe bromicola]|uniref:C2H2-type domain-containing protein n=1 Tax=Epichloe bromicola TaxID=79588 RepID=A0ABQ0CM01_9HYPO
MLPCKQCGQTVPDTRALKLHNLAAHCCKCPKCHEILSSPRKVRRHLVHAHDFRVECPDCPLIFEGTDEVRRHQVIFGHSCCGDCGETFDSTDKYREHIAETQHSTDFVCCDCGTGFVNAERLREHHGGVSPRARQDIEPCPICSRRFLSRACRRAHVGTCELTCGLCRRCFKSHAALLDHLNSLKHRPLGKFTCAGAPKCNKTFSSPSGMISHVESGSCKSGVGRDKVRALIEAHDTDRLITKPVDRVDRVQSVLLGVNDGLETSSAPQPCTSRSGNSTPSSESSAVWVVPSPASDVVSLNTASGMSSPNVASSSIIHDGLELPEHGSDGAGALALLTPTTSGGSGGIPSLGSGSWMLTDSLTNGIALSNDMQLSSAGGVTPSFPFIPRASPATSYRVQIPSGSLSPPSLRPCTSVQQGRDRASYILDLAESSPDNRCPICPDTRRRFKSKAALLGHVRSAAHEEPIYSCPTALVGSGHAKTFSTLAGLAAHVESGACADGKDGLMTVIGYLETRLKESGLDFGLASLSIREKPRLRNKNGGA